MTITDSRPAEGHPSPADVSPAASNSRPAVEPPTSEVAAPDGSASPAAGLPPTPGDVPLRGTKTTGGQASHATLSALAAGSSVPDPAANHAPTSVETSLLDPALSLAADILDDLERVRVANENRLRQLTRTDVDKDGGERGFGLDESHPDVARLAAMVEVLTKVEHDAALNLARKLRKHPLGAWVKATKGVGEKQGARLLAAIGDPYVRPEMFHEDGSVKSKEGPRTVSALWAYCGLHVLPGGHSSLDSQSARAAEDQHRDTDHGPIDTHTRIAGVAAKRRKGERANWSTTAKTRAYLIAESCLKQLDSQCKASRSSCDARAESAGPALRHVGRGGLITADAQSPRAAPACSCSPYRVVYDDRRAHTAVTRPEWTDGHSRQDALRVASKAILRDLWRAARDWHLANAQEVSS